MKELAYRIYICDSLFASGDNKHLTQRYTDILKPKKIDKRNGDEIAADVINKLGLKVN